MLWIPKSQPNLESDHAREVCDFFQASLQEIIKAMVCGLVFFSINHIFVVFQDSSVAAIHASLVSTKRKREAFVFNLNANEKRKKIIVCQKKSFIFFYLCISQQDDHFENIITESEEEFSMNQNDVSNEVD